MAQDVIYSGEGSVCTEMFSLKGALLYKSNSDILDYITVRGKS